MPAVSVRISGRVQGVGFRAFVLQVSQEYGLTGEVWNWRDGNVEAIFSSADASTLAAAMRALQGGPGRIDTIASEPIAHEPTFEGFRVTATC